ncbi:GNAT family N-acetyltransferase [Pseudoclavibacter sp. VKM Ac-2867]|uniref:GNAT family N-acetyltransferase n=1 Tax=Pseudoclavibacter sp. VKM Ac-2867 TaxID=2783829 RepID=UPI00188B7C0F|nr:GNAT family N-acetyltransferase [Pseudoclavibacter sp. VKM Ac-2867]MBF4458757.1 GNAT family N-acetyltransferase [Pseudoclavibacter sp. VKM Ac-2867]
MSFRAFLREGVGRLRGRGIGKAVSAPVLETRRLLLRAHTLASAEEWFLLHEEARVREFLNWPPRSRGQALRHLRVRTQSTRLRRAEDFMALAVELEGRLIGDISLHLRTVASEVRSVEIGWVLHPDAQGNGYAREAAEAVIQFAFEAVQARMILAVVHPRNAGSLRLAERLGFHELSRRESERLLVLTRDDFALADRGAERDPNMALPRPASGGRLC